MFSSDAVAPKQKLSLVFQFAIVNGYFELMNFIWERVSEPQREYIGMDVFRYKHHYYLTQPIHIVQIKMRLMKECQV